jgi:hypothetical protein
MDLIKLRMMETGYSEELESINNIKELNAFLNL